MRAYIESLSTGQGRNNQALHTKKIIQWVLQEGGKTIPEMKEFSGLSLPTMMKLISELVEQGIFIESGKRESSGGRPPAIFSLHPSLGYIVGIELLIHSFRFSIVNLNHELIYEYETDSFNLNQTEESLRYILRIVPELLQKKGISHDKILGVGVGITGRVNGKKGISHTFLQGAVPLAQVLQEQWGFPVFVDNDTRLMTLGEQNFGLAQEKQNVVYLNISQGLGMGLISNGQLHDGASGFAGEFGHIHFEDNDQLCVCGKKGCLETVVSGYALEARYRALFPTKPTPRYTDIISRLQGEDPAIREIVSEMGKSLGQALSTLVQILNPSLIIIGGRFAPIGEWLRYPITKGLSLYGLPQLVDDVEIKASQLGDKTTMLGAYALVMKSVFD